jgi:hypothetical protein
MKNMKTTHTTQDPLVILLEVQRLHLEGAALDCRDMSHRLRSVAAQLRQVGGSDATAADLEKIAADLSVVENAAWLKLTRND